MAIGRRGTAASCETAPPRNTKESGTRQLISDNLQQLSLPANGPCKDATPLIGYFLMFYTFHSYLKQPMSVPSATPAFSPSDYAIDNNIGGVIA